MSRDARTDRNEPRRPLRHRFAGTALAVAGALASVALATDAPGDPLCFDSHVPNGDLRHVARRGDTLWFGTAFGGVVELDTATTTAWTYSRSRHALPSDAINDIAVDRDGGVWIATWSGVGYKPPGTRRDGPWAWFDAARTPITSDTAQTVAGAADGGVWIGTFDAGAFLFDGTSWSHYDVAGGALSDDYVTSIVVGPRGDTWLGVWSAGVDQFDGTTFTNHTPASTGTPADHCPPGVVYPPASMGLSTVFVWPRAADPTSGAVLFSSQDDPIFCDLTGEALVRDGVWTGYTSSNSGIVYAVEDAAFGPDGTLWLASANGLQRRVDGQFEDLELPPGAGNAAYSVETVGNDVWFGTPFGAQRWRDGRFEGFPVGGLEDGLIQDVAFRETPGGTEAWVGLRTGVQWYDGVRWQTLSSDDTPLAPVGITAIEVDAEGALWFGAETVYGAQRFDGVAWTEYTSENSGLHADGIAAIRVEPTSGALWFGFRFEKGVSRFDGTDWTTYLPPPLPPGCGDPVTQRHEVPNNPIGDIEVAPDGTAWMASVCGLTRFDGTEWETFTVDDGLASNVVHDVAVDSNGAVWAATRDGVTRFDGGTWTSWLTDVRNDIGTIVVDGDDRPWLTVLNRGVYRFDDLGGEWTLFGVGDGLVNDRVRSSGVHPDGDVWLGTELGVGIATGCACAADLTTTDALPGEPDFGEPDGVVDASDARYYRGLFQSADPAADLQTTGATEGTPLFGIPDGTVDTSDARLYRDRFLAGCP